MNRFRILYALAIGLLLVVVMTGSMVGNVAYAQDATDPEEQQEIAETAISGNWIPDSSVTELGKSSERARELLFWVFSHPPIYNAPVIREMWSVTRYISFLFIAVALVGLAAHLLLAKTKIGPTFDGISSRYDIDLSVKTIIVRLVFMVLFVAFSYTIVLGIVQLSSISMRFFIETIGGCDLFNIRFAGQGSLCAWPGDPGYEELVRQMEANYTEFTGYSFQNSAGNNNEMISTSFFLIKATTFTYNALSVIMILRYVILWFFIILSPILALLMPFIFIRNTGYIWIGEFFRWLFYGPLVVLFIASTSRIWKAGIPFAFDFTRINTREGFIYPTSINILYGGPAQTLSRTNTSNYVDTYAEYVIALVMLWAAIILPWLLLKIFRDYCCATLKENRSAIMQLVNQMKTSLTPGGPLGPIPVKPTGDVRAKLDLPYKQPIKVNAEITSTKPVDIVANIKDIASVPTVQLTGDMDVRVRTIQDVARIETNQVVRKNVHTTLERFEKPEIETNETNRRRIASVREEFDKRARQGDIDAKRVLNAAKSMSAQEAIRATRTTSAEILRKAVSERQVTASQVHQLQTNSAFSARVAKQSSISQDRVNKVLRSVPNVGTPVKDQSANIVKTSGVSKGEVDSILSAAQDAISSATAASMATRPHQVKAVASRSNVSTQQVQEVLTRVSSMKGSREENVKALAEETNMTEKVVDEILDSAEKVSKVPTISSRVSIDDYEETKAMWEKHYRDSEVMQTETIKSREQWVNNDVTMLQNALDLLTANQEAMQERGMKMVMDSLPFLLLGGFNDADIVVYMKAKLEAAKSVQQELNRESQRQAAQKTLEEDLVVIPATQSPTAHEKEQEQALEMPLPGEEGPTAEDLASSNQESTRTQEQGTTDNRNNETIEHSTSSEDGSNDEFSDPRKVPVNMSQEDKSKIPSSSTDEQDLKSQNNE